MSTENPHDDRPEDDSIPFFPDHARTEYWVALGILGIFIIVGILGQINPIGLGEPADPLNTPLHVKPEWYFLGLYQMLKYVPEIVGILIPILGVLIVMLWPFIDRRRTDSVRARRIRIIAVVVFLLAYGALTILGEVS